MPINRKRCEIATICINLTILLYSLTLLGFLIAILVLVNNANNSVSDIKNSLGIESKISQPLPAELISELKHKLGIKNKRTGLEYEPIEEDYIQLLKLSNENKKGIEIKPEPIQEIVKAKEYVQIQELPNGMIELKPVKVQEDNNKL
jgi:hypothetical protein